MVVEVRIAGRENSIICGRGANLLETLTEAGVFVENPCNGTGVCGKCKVRILSGEVAAISEAEQRILSEAERRQGIRLACMVEVRRDLRVELLQQEGPMPILTEGYVPAGIRDPEKVGYGAAIDIGTTTVVVSLIRLKSGKELAAAAGINPQRKYGQDVLTRISYEWEHPEDGVDKLQTEVVGAINDLIGQVCGQAGIRREEIGEIAVAANCTMMHMFLGVDARALGRAPYEPEFVEARIVAAEEIGLQAGEDYRAAVYCLPQVSAFVGADIVAGAYVCGLEKAKGNVLLIDMGTNGELVLSRNGRLLSCACAAGPALEGMNIRCGMRAAAGAIEDVRITEDGVRLCCIGQKAPVGICGSGVLAAVRELVRTGLVKKNGAFVKMDSLAATDYRYPMLRTNGKKREFVLCEDPEIRITQGDVRQIQLAKGAILSGVQVLLDRAGIRMEELDQILIAGQFGAHLPAESLTGAGILPKALEDKIVYVGNASKTGAYLALLSEEAKREMEALSGRIESMELAEVENYDRILAACMEFS